MATDELHEAAALRQSLFRSVNQRVRELVATDPAVFLCECVDLSCVEQILLPVDAYERIRRMPTWFLVKPGHVLPQVEHVTEATAEYAVVEKVGAAAALAAELDPDRR